MANLVLLERIKNEIKEKKLGPTTPFRYCRTSGTVGSGIAKFSCISKNNCLEFFLISNNVFEIWIILENMAIVALFIGLDGIHLPGKSVR